MKRYWHFLWYAAGLTGLVGLFLKWGWFQDPFFPLFCFVSAQLTRIQTGAKQTIMDRPFENRWLEKFAIGSVVAMMIGITGYFYYLKYVEFPANEKRDIEEFKNAWHRKMEIQK